MSVDVPPRDGPFVPPPELPDVVRRYLASHGYVALTVEQYRELHDEARGRPSGCPYPLYRDHWGGWHHRRYAGTILEKEGEELSGLHVVQCEACGSVAFETPVAIA